MKEHDHTPLLGFIGFTATLSLGDVHLLVGIVAGMATVVYVVSKTAILWTRGPRSRSQDE